MRGEHGLVYIPAAHSVYDSVEAGSSVSCVGESPHNEKYAFWCSLALLGTVCESLEALLYLWDSRSF